MRGTPPGRKAVFKDIRVIAALEALEAAVLAVNGDKEVVSRIVLVDVKTNDGSTGMAAVDLAICNCPGCVNRFVDLLGSELTSAAAARVRDKRRAVH